MRVLLDTHAILWWFADDPALGAPAMTVIEDPDNTILVSAASVWEICTKVRIGKLAAGRALCDDFSEILQHYHFEPLSISMEHSRLAGRMPGAHKDPFDRMLAAQALLEGVPMITSDPAIAGFGVTVIW